MSRIAAHGGPDDARHWRQHRIFSVVSGVFKKSFQNVRALIVKNCSTNQAISTKLKKALLGCACHNFQMSLREIISEEKGVAEMVHSFMVELLGKLPEPTQPCAKIANDASMNPVLDMLQKHGALGESLANLTILI